MGRVMSNRGQKKGKKNDLTSGEREKSTMSIFILAHEVGQVPPAYPAFC